MLVVCLSNICELMSSNRGSLTYSLCCLNHTDKHHAIVGCYSPSLYIYNNIPVYNVPWHGQCWLNAHIASSSLILRNKQYSYLNISFYEWITGTHTYSTYYNTTTCRRNSWHRARSRSRCHTIRAKVGVFSECVVLSFPSFQKTDYCQLERNPSRHISPLTTTEQCSLK